VPAVLGPSLTVALTNFGELATATVAKSPKFACSPAPIRHHVGVGNAPEGDADRRSRIASIADHLLAAYDEARMIEPVSTAWPDFDSAAAYEVLGHIAARRRAAGWVAVGRKIGFTNRSIWPRYGVDRPMWAPVWDRTLHAADDGSRSVSLRGLVQPRIEPEVVFGIGAPVPATDDAAAVLACVDWIAPGFEIVQCPFPDWKFALADCTAAFGLHAALVVGPRLAVDGASRATLVDTLTSFEATLCRDGSVVARGTGAHVLDSPALAVAHLAGVLRDQPRSELLSPGEIVTTGTLTDAWPLSAGETWESDYGDLGVAGLRVTFT
jgi:2-oxo-3-hexenedioate decarboxylase